MWISNKWSSVKIGNEGSKTKRDFELNFKTNSKRIIDLTVRWSNQFEILILEVSCVDILNKIPKLGLIYAPAKERMFYTFEKIFIILVLYNKI